MRKIFYPFASGYVFQTKMAASFFSKKIQEKGCVIPNPLDTNKIPLPYLGERKRVIVSAGRLDNQKNFKLLIDSFAEFYKTHPDYSLRIYGEGNLRNELEVYAESVLGTENWSMPGRNLGWLNESYDCAMFVLSSDYEGMPNALIEAMAAGIPCISTDCPSGGSAELIINNKNGILVPVGNKKAIFDAMCELSKDKELAKRLSINAVELKVRLSLDKIAKEWFNYMGKVM
ncbi:MAG: glycosyltransferase, partial [Clostridia bacterium]|nr:glycosyltransferase [Clostridia bacterium]